MNNFLLLFGTQLPEIRRLLNWTQDDVAAKTGISRATIVGFEKDPTKLHKYFALAIFAVILYELAQRRHRLKSINFNSDTLRTELDKLGFSSKLVGSLFPSVIACAGIVNRAAFSFIPRFFSKTPDTSNVDAEKLKHYVESSIQYIESKLHEAIGLEKLDMTCFVKMMEQGETND